MLLGFLGTGFYSYSRGVFLPALAETLADGSRMQISIGFSLAAIVGAIVSPWLGKFLDSHSPRLVILTGIVIVSLAYVGLASVQNLWQFYFIVGVGFGLGMSCMGGMAWHRCVIFWFDHWRGRAIAFAVMGASLAGIMMPPLVTYIVDNFGWRNGYYSFAVSTAVSLLPVVYFLLKDRPADIGEVRDGHRYVASHQTEQVQVADDSRVWTWQQLLRSRAFWSIGLIFGSMVCVFAAVMLHLFGHLLDIGLSTAQAALVLSTTAIFAAGGKPVIGVLQRYAINGGAALALACDLLMVGRAAYLQVGEVQIGMAAPYNLAWLSLRHSESVTARISLLGERIMGDDLLDMGVAQICVDDHELLQQGHARAAHLAAFEGHGLLRIKAGLRAGLGMTADQWFDQFTGADPIAHKPKPKATPG